LDAFEERLDEIEDKFREMDEKVNSLM